MIDSVAPLPPGLGNELQFGCAGPWSAGVCFRLSLPYRDETRVPPSSGRFDHEWVVSPLELSQAEWEGRGDSLLLRRRAREQQLFLRMVRCVLGRSRARLVRIGRDLVLRRADG